jgi:hypothetical protein
MATQAEYDAAEAALNEIARPYEQHIPPIFAEKIRQVTAQAAKAAVDAAAKARGA